MATIVLTQTEVLRIEGNLRTKVIYELMANDLPTGISRCVETETHERTRRKTVTHDVLWKGADCFKKLEHTTEQLAHWIEDHCP